MSLIAQIQANARGRWNHILPELFGVPPEAFSTRHGPCLNCGGKDRFRGFDDFAETGGTVCNQCGANNDGIATVAWRYQCSVAEAVHRLAEYLGLKQVASHWTTPTNDERQIRDRIYRAILTKLPLRKASFVKLRERGLTDQAIESRQYRTMHGLWATNFAVALEKALSAKQLKGLESQTWDDLTRLIPGLIRDEHGRARLAAPDGIIVPVRNVDGLIIALKVRREHPGDGPKYLYCSASRTQREAAAGKGYSLPKAEAAVHVPLGTPSRAEIVRVTEGELKADIATERSGVPTISIPGVTMWERALPVLHKLKAKRVIVALDADHKENPAVAKAVIGLARQCQLDGFDVALEVWDSEHGKGIDDLLATGNQPTLLTGEALAQYLADNVQPVAEKAPSGSDEAAQAKSNEWPELNPFDVMDLPLFPVHVLPPVLRQWVEAESHATQTPPDLAALLAIAMVAGSIARRVCIEARPGWSEPANLFVSVLLEPGNRKSAVFSDAQRPLLEVQKELQQAARPSIARLKSERRQLEKKLAHLEKQAAEKNNAEAAQTALEIAEQLARTAEPTEPRLIVDDATSEKLGVMLAEQGGRLMSASPEGSVFDVMAGLYSKSGMPQFGVYLMGHSGDLLQVDRISRASLTIERPALTCAYAIQPQVIDGLASNAAFRGRGLLARFLYAAPRSWLGDRIIAPPPVPEDIANAYENCLRRLAADESEAVLRLSPDASEAFLNWEQEIEGMLGEGGELESIRDWGAKLAGATLRMAGALHCAEWDRIVAIAERTIQAGIEIARYLIPHAQQVLTLMSATNKPAEDDARYVLRWMNRHSKTEFTERDVHQHCKRRFPQVADLRLALTELEQRGFIRPVPVVQDGRGRPPSPKYEVNPAILVTPSRSQNSHKAITNSPSSNSGNSENGFSDDQNTTPQSDWGEV